MALLSLVYCLCVCNCVFVNILDDAIIARYFEFQIGSGIPVLAFHDSAPFIAFLNTVTQVSVSLRP